MRRVVERRRPILKRGVGEISRIAIVVSVCYCIMAMSHLPDPRGAALRAFDRHAEELTRDYALRFAAGARLAQAEAEALHRLAATLTDNLAALTPLVAGLEGALLRPFDPRRAGLLMLESVFDEVLAPDAWRVLAAALELAQG